jgi:hypothetical protein
MDRTNVLVFLLDPAKIVQGQAFEHCVNVCANFQLERISLIEFRLIKGDQQAVVINRLIEAITGPEDFKNNPRTWSRNNRGNQTVFLYCGACGEPLRVGTCRCGVAISRLPKHPDVSGNVVKAPTMPWIVYDHFTMEEMHPWIAKHLPYGHDQRYKFPHGKPHVIEYLLDYVEFFLVDPSSITSEGIKDATKMIMGGETVGAYGEVTGTPKQKTATLDQMLIIQAIEHDPRGRAHLLKNSRVNRVTKQLYYCSRCGSGFAKGECPRCKIAFDSSSVPGGFVDRTQPNIPPLIVAHAMNAGHRFEKTPQ